MKPILNLLLALLTLLAFSGPVSAESAKSTHGLRKEFFKEVGAAKVAPAESTNAASQPAQDADASGMIGSAASTSPVWPLLLLSPALLFAVVWVKRGSKAKMEKGAIRKLSGLPLGQKKSLVIVEVQGARMLLGVTDKGIQLLTRLEEEEQAQAAEEAQWFDEGLKDKTAESDFESRLAQRLSSEDQPVFLSRSYDSNERQTLATKLSQYQQAKA